MARTRAAKARRDDPVAATKSSDALRAKAREAALARWADPAMRDKMIAAMRTTPKRHKNKGTRPRTESGVTSEMREKYSVAAKARWADPTTGTKIRDALRDPENRAKMREAAKARWADPSMRKEMIAGMRIAGKRRRSRGAAGG